MAAFPWFDLKGAPAPPDERAHILSLINEVWMLIDFIAGRSDQALKKVEVETKPGSGVNMSPMQLLAEVSRLNAHLAPAAAVPGLNDRAFMQIVRDALNGAIAPATGLSVAYSTMVAGPLRRHSASRFALARQAYENLAPRARWHRALSIAILTMSIFVTGVAVWESAKVALGKALLQNLDTLRVQQTSLTTEKLKFDLSLANATETKQQLSELLRRQQVPLTAYSVCDRALVLFALSKNQTDPQAFAADRNKDPGPRMLFYGSAEERDLCGRDDILRANLGIVHQGLVTYSQNWPGMVGSVFSITRSLFVCFRLSCPDPAGTAAGMKQDDIEFNIAPLLLVWGNLVLPIIFSFIGSAIFVTRDHYTKVRDSLLLPRDFFLAPVRLALGLVVGACVGLFFSAYGPVPPSQIANSASALISSLTLTASGVAFLAGFGVEAVFSLLEGLINRVFKEAA